MSKRKRTYGTGGCRQLSNGNFRLKYKGQEKVVKADNRKQAEKLLSAWVDEIDKAESSTPDVSMNQLFDLYVRDHEARGRAETGIVKKKLAKYLRPRLGNLDAKLFDQEQLDTYLASRRKDSAKNTKRPPENATLNREISIISKALRLGRAKIQRLVPLELLPENPPRQGIVNESVYHLMLHELPDYVKPIWCFAYYTGVRSGELKKLRWEWLDWEEWVIRVPGRFQKERITKNGKLHIIPVFLEMREFLKIMYPARNPACPYLFQRDGQRVKSFRTAFNNARERLGIPELLFHDQRRTAVTNMLRERIPEKQAMAVSGHLDSSMLKRYGIVEEEDVKEVGQQMAKRFVRLREQKQSELGQTDKLGQKLGHAVSEPSWEADSETAAKLKQ